MDSHTKHVPTWTMADRMRKARTDVGMSQQQIADTIGIARKTVTNYENGDTRPLRAILNAWAEVTGTYVEWLEHGTVPFPPEPQGVLVTSGANGSLTHEKLIVRHPPEWIRTRQEWNNGRAREHHTTTYGGFTCALISTASRQPRTAARNHSRLHLMARPTRTMGRR